MTENFARFQSAIKCDVASAMMGGLALLDKMSGPQAIHTEVV